MVKTLEPTTLQAYLHTQREAIVSFVQQLVAYETPSTDPESQRAALDFLTGALEAVGCRVLRMPGRGASGGQLLARPRRRKRGRPYQVMIGHVDTVWPAGTLAKMPCVIEGDVLKGPGAFDMKGGVTQMVFALRALQYFGVVPEVTPVVFLNTDEEIDSDESAHRIARLAKGANRALVLEPALGHDGKLKTQRKGVGKFVIEIEGRSAHAGLDPTAGASAILELSHVIQKLHAFNDLERGTTVNVGIIDGGQRPNVIAPASRAVVDVRVRTVADGQALERAVYALEPTTSGTVLHVSGGISRAPMEATPRNQRLWEAARAAGQRLGLDLEGGLAGGGSDGNITTVYTATLDGLGVVGGGAHATHEHFLIPSILERTALLTMLLLLPALHEETPAEEALEAEAVGARM